MEHPKPTYPSDHEAGLRVPKGGSSCASCKYLKDREERICGNPYFVRWNNGSNVIPGKIDEYCSDYYEPVRLQQGKSPMAKAFGGKDEKE